MTDDKEREANEYAIGHLSAILEVELHESGFTVGEGMAEKLAEIAIAALRQPDARIATTDEVKSVDYLRGYDAGLHDLKALTAEEDGRIAREAAIEECATRVEGMGTSHDSHAGERFAKAIRALAE